MGLLDDHLRRLLSHFDGLTDVQIEMKDDPIFNQNSDVIAFWRKPYVYLATDFTDRAKLEYGTDWSKRLDEILIRPLIHAWLESKGDDYFKQEVAGLNVNGINEYFLWKAHELGLDMSQEVLQFPILKPYWDMIQIGWNPFGNSKPIVTKVAISQNQVEFQIQQMFERLGKMKLMQNSQRTGFLNSILDAVDMEVLYQYGREHFISHIVKEEVREDLSKALITMGWKQDGDYFRRKLELDLLSNNPELQFRHRCFWKIIAELYHQSSIGKAGSQKEPTFSSEAHYLLSKKFRGEEIPDQYKKIMDSIKVE